MLLERGLTIRIEPIARALDRALSVALGLALAVPVWRFLSVLPTRLRYPMELEWMEGGIVSHIQVVLSGQPLYRAPSLEFTPFIYTPFYYYVSAVVSKLVGVGYFAPRLVSAASAVLSFALLGWWVWRETRDLLASWVSIGLLAATYALSGSWFDLARADSLSLLLVLIGYVLARFGKSAWLHCAAGAVFALAVFTKQTLIVLALPGLLSDAVHAPRRRWLGAATFGVIVGLGAAIFEVASQGWFWFYVVHLPAQHGVDWTRWREGVVDVIWPSITIMVVAGVAVVCGTAGVAGGLRGWVSSAGFVLGAWTVGVTGLLHTGGYPNVLIPALAALAWATGIIFARLRTGRGSTWFGRRSFTVAAVLMQLGLLSFGAVHAIPSARDRTQGARIIARLAAVPGPIWCTSSSYYPVLAGHTQGMTHSMALADVFKSRDEPVKRLALAEVRNALSSGRVRAVVVDRAVGFLPDEIAAIIRGNYHFSAHVLDPDPGGLWPNTGAAVRPDEIWTANLPAPKGAPVGDNAHE